MRISPRLSDGFLDIPYGSDSELLSRSDLAKRLTKLHENLEHGTVAILHGRWGTGKTTFIRKWLAGLSDERFTTVYFSAFTNDYIDNPFIALNASLLAKLNVLSGKRDADVQRFRKTAAAVSKKLLIAGAKVGVKAATLGALSLSDLDIAEDVLSATADATSDLAEVAVTSILDEHAKAEATFTNFREALKKIASHRPTQGDAQNGKLIFVIDELDRCRPDFALGIIETIKHFFDVDDMHFVLVANKEFLVKSVAAKYGLGQSSEEYLDKFFNFTVFFEEAASFRNSSAQVTYAQSVIGELLGRDSQDAHEIGESVSEIAGAFTLTLRQIEKIATNAALAYSAFAEREYRPAFLVAYLCFLKAIHPVVFTKIKQRKFDFSDIEPVLKGGDWEEHSNIDRVLQILEYHSAKTIDENDARFTQFSSGTRFNFRSRLDILPYMANSVIDRFARV